LRPKENSKNVPKITITQLAISSFWLVLIVEYFWPNFMPFSTFQFFQNNQILDGIIASWPIFLWAIVVTTISALTTKSNPKLNREAEKILAGGFAVSAVRGPLEEIIFRWILFFSSIISIQVTNFLFFDWLGFGIAEWLHLNFFGPIINFITFGKMHWLIFAQGWAVGAAALSVNAFFREGHRYLGPFGYVNSWVIGFFYFWIMFNYGLIPCMISHALYNLSIFIIIYIKAASGRARGIV